VTWISYRFVTGVGNVNWMVQGARVSGAAPLDAAPITVSPPGSRPKAGPRVAFGGDNWLVVWADGRNGIGNDSDPYGARVQDATGTVLDSDGIRVATVPSGLLATPSVASDGTDFVVTGWNTTAARVSSATGAVSLVTVKANVDSSVPTVAFANGTYQFVWNGLFGLTANRLLATGEALDGTGVVLRRCTSSATNLLPSVFAAGSGFYITWLERGPDEIPGGVALFDILGSRYSTAGGLADHAGTSLTNGANAQSIVDIEGGGVNGWLVVWRDTRGSAASMYAGRVDPSGRSLDPAGIALGTTSSPAVAFNGAHYLLVWQHPAASNTASSGIVARRIDAATGQLLDPTISVTPPASSSFSATQPDVASDGTDWFVVWTQRTAASMRATGARITGAGVNLDPAGIPLNTETAIQSDAKVGFGAGVYLTVWTVPDTTRTDARIVHGARIDPASGAGQDPTPATYQTNFWGRAASLPSSSDLAARVSSSWTGEVVCSCHRRREGCWARSPYRPAAGPHRVWGSRSTEARCSRCTTPIPGRTRASFRCSAPVFGMTAPISTGRTSTSSRPRTTPASAWWSPRASRGKILVGRDSYDPNPSVAAVRVKTRVVQTCGGDGGCVGPDDAGVPSDDAQPIIASADAGPMLCPADAAAVDGGGDEPGPAEPTTEAGVPDAPVGSDAASAMDAADTAVATDAEVATDATVPTDGPVLDGKPADATAPADGGGGDARTADARGGSGDSGCGCRTGGSRSGARSAAVALGLALVLARRRRRNRSPW
jgi:MYXO-CTERM domain-containing protein